MPVAAYPVPGPKDVIGRSQAGALDTDLWSAAMTALQISPAAARAHAGQFSWQRVAQLFTGYLAVPAARGVSHAAGAAQFSAAPP